MSSLKEAAKWNRPYEVPDPEAFSSYQREIYSAFRAPIFSTKPSEWEALARKAVPEANFGYVFGSASSQKTYASNLAAFDRYRLRPSMLVNATRRDMSVNLFGTTYKSPILVAPVGVQNIMHSDAEEATARACKNVGVPMILSTAATRTIEEVAEANGDGDRWYLLAWRPVDLDHSYLPFLWGDGCQIGHSDPVFNERYAEMLAQDTRSNSEKLSEAWNLIKRNGTTFGALRVLGNAAKIAKSRAWLDVMNSGTYREWQHLEVLKKLWDGPIVLKGIQTVADAHKAIEYGIDGIIVSNHGGRQLDGAIASLDALAEIGADEKVKQSGLTVLFDSGIRTGSDVLKAIALGAKAVLVARPYM
jgi:lactate 2-monooxygenase